MWIWDEKGKKKIENKPKNYFSLENFPKIEGYNLEGEFDFSKFLASYLHMGFQGSNLGMGIQLFQDMLQKKKEGKLQLFFAFTGNMISSGNRELITYLVKNKLVDAITTTAAALEEDVIKCMKPFHLGNFEVKGEFLQQECIGRIGNIFAPYDRYLYLEKVLNNYFKTLDVNKVLSTHEFSAGLGKHIEKDAGTKEKCKESFLYWANKNNIPVFCPGITDGAIGDISTFFKKNNPGFAIDSVKDNVVLTDLLMHSEEAGSIILGGGIAKHFLLNAAIFRDGFERSIYVTTATEFDGSDSGGNQEEAISWSKIKPEAKRVKIVADATIVFPLLMASTVAKKVDTTKHK